MSDEYRRIEVITGTARRRRWSIEEKLRILDESLEPGESVSAVARRNGVAPNLLYRWRRLMNQGGAGGGQFGGAPLGRAHPRAGAAVGPQDHGGRDPERGTEPGTGKKTDLALAVVADGRFPVKAVADTLSVARSNLVVRAAWGRRSRPPYRKAGDPELLARIRALVDQRPTYGYRRITALLNREHA